MCFYASRGKRRYSEAGGLSRQGELLKQLRGA